MTAYKRLFFYWKITIYGDNAIEKITMHQKFSYLC